MQNPNHWHLCDAVSIFQAIMLSLGYDPQNLNHWQLENNQGGTLPVGYNAVKTAILNAVRNNVIEADIKNEYDSQGNNQYEDTIDINETIIQVGSLKNFFIKKGFKDAFFILESDNIDEYLDPNNQFYAPKLAASINAWKSVTENPEVLNGKTPKQALEKWLRLNATKYNLTKEDGTLNETGIQEICKIANWNPSGGAAKTPTPPMASPNPPTIKKTPSKLMVWGEKVESKNYGESEFPF